MTWGQSRTILNAKQSTPNEGTEARDENRPEATVSVLASPELEGRRSLQNSYEGEDGSELRLIPRGLTDPSK